MLLMYVDLLSSNNEVIRNRLAFKLHARKELGCIIGDNYKMKTDKMVKYLKKVLLVLVKYNDL